MAGAIRCGALWTQGLVENLLCAATIRAGQLRLRSAPLDIVERALEMRAIVEPLLERKGLRVRVTSRRGPVEACADGRRVDQLLINLMANAIKFAGSGTTIVVTVAGGPAGVRVAVADRGPGFPSGSAARLFEPFYRAAGAAGDGVGLGLAIVRWLAEAHGGRVGAANRRGGGACVWFELPRGARDAATAGGS